MDRPSSRYQLMLTALGEAQPYPHPADKIVHLSTHISDIFLAGSYAYKVKKPINLGFLDFTTLSRRQRACEDEVHLNRRLAPQIYLGVVPIHERQGRWIVGNVTDSADGKATDYGVKMIRLPQEGMLDRVATSAQLERTQMRNIARQLARFHAVAERGPHIDHHGSLNNISDRVRQNLAETEPYIGRTISQTQFTRIRSYTEHFLQDNASVFSERVRAGRIVDGHGDLHLGNMCLYNDDVVIFDCIEFSQDFRAGDAIGDVAFLTMDLDALAQSQFGNCFINDYLQRTDDYEGLIVLDFYQAYRACVRGKVLSLLQDSQKQLAQQGVAEDKALRYFELAESYATGRTGGLLITCGPSASGKTTAALHIAESIGGIVIRSDAVRKHLAGVPLEQSRTARYGEGLYNADMTARTYQGLLQRARPVLESGRWAILDATYLRRAQRRQVATLASALKSPFGIIRCIAPTHELEQRLDRRSHTGQDISDATHAVLQHQLHELQEPGSDEADVFRWTGNEDPEFWISRLAPRV